MERLNEKLIEKIKFRNSFSEMCIAIASLRKCISHVLSFMAAVAQQSQFKEYPILENMETESLRCFSSIFYEEDETLSFIETAAPPPIFVTILGINTWEVPGDKLLALLKEKDSINMEISDGGCNPIFENTHITLWDLDEQYDHIGDYKTLKWGAIGIGDERYYKSICHLED